MWPQDCTYLCRRRIVSTLIRASIAIVLLNAVVRAQPSAKTCEVKLTSPFPGDKVGSAGRVRGTAKVPAGTFLWVFLHMKDLVMEWWPQGGRAAVINEDGSWVMVVGYGQERDRNSEFEVAAAVINEETDAKLRQHFQRAQFNDRCCGFPPIAFPATVHGCPVVKVTVLKTSH